MVKVTKPAYVQRMKLGDFELTSIVCDKEEFDENIDTIKEVFCIKNGERAGQDQINTIKNAGHLPLCTKGTKTIHLFEKYNVETNLLAIIVRGKGKDLIKEIIKNDILRQD